MLIRNLFHIYVQSYWLSCGYRSSQPTRFRASILFWNAFVINFNVTIDGHLNHSNFVFPFIPI